jgi:signal transduction histidine kinase
VTSSKVGSQQFTGRAADNQIVIARAARTFLAVELMLGVGYFLLPDSLLRAVVYCLLGVGMVVAVVVGARLHQPSRPLAWYLLAAGQLSFTAGDAINYTYQWVLEVEPPYPSVADGFYLACYALLASGLLLLVRERAPGRDIASLIDATVVTTGLGMLSWVFLIGPNVRVPDLMLSQRLVSIAYPLCDVLLVAVAMRLWRTGGHATFASRLLTLGLVALLAADTVYGLSLLGGGWDAGGPVDATWMIFYLGFGLAALHPSMVSLSEPTPPSTRLTRTRLALLAGASLMAPAVLVIQTLREEPIDVGVIAGGSVVLFLLTLARMGGLASEVAMQAERKRAMQTVLRATEQERVRLAADLHDGPVQELTALRYGLTRARNRIQRGEPGQAESLMAELEDELASGITGLRRLMAELRPAVLDEQGLEVALQNQVRAFEATSGVACAISTGLQTRLAPDLETVLYRVTQESLNNIGKHAGASRVTVSLATENGSVRLRINDDGVGFDPVVASRLLSEGHFGLAGMRERVEMVGGRLVVDSAPGRGTTVAVEMANKPAGSRSSQAGR